MVGGSGEQLTIDGFFGGQCSGLEFGVQRAVVRFLLRLLRQRKSVIGVTDGSISFFIGDFFLLYFLLGLGARSVIGVSAGSTQQVAEALILRLAVKFRLGVPDRSECDIEE